MIEIDAEIGKWKVISQSFLKKKNLYYKCRCICGVEKDVRSSHLLDGSTTNCGCCKASGKKSKLWRGYGEISKQKFNFIGYSAKYRNIEFDITIEYIWNLFLKQERKCALSGILLSFSEKDRQYDGTASLDRINSSRGYVVGNVQWVHKDINYMKQEYDEKYFYDMCRKVAQNPKPRVKILNDLENLDLSSFTL